MKNQEEQTETKKTWVTPKLTVIDIEKHTLFAVYKTGADGESSYS